MSVISSIILASFYQKVIKWSKSFRTSKGINNGNFVAKDSIGKTNNISSKS